MPSHSCRVPLTAVPACALIVLFASAGCGGESGASADGGADACADCGMDGPVSVCGDGFVDPTRGEVCDDGNTDSGDGCSGDCLLRERCGNGAVEGSLGEVCDDGNLVSGDGCSADCGSDESCGNGMTDTPAGEECDDGNEDAGDGCADCTVERCGNARVDPGEECDDGNRMDGDGCDACVLSCTEDAQCGNESVCDGDEVCDPSTHTCQPADPAADGTACSLDEGAGICRDGGCVLSQCGDGVADGAVGEDCDDGNTSNGDGCENDCTFSCASDGDCDDGNACSGAETCDTTSHACTSAAPLADGTPCGAGGLCRAGSCAAVTCGDGVVDASEDCDDANAVAGDGCENDCSYSCSGDADCSDGDPCNGVEACDPSSHTCTAGAPADDGSACDLDGSASTRDICLSATCVRSRCGDLYVDSTEQCDDGNTADGDGCDNDCTFSCAADADCDDGLVCNGAETCDISSHTCDAGPPAADGTACDSDGDTATRDICLAAACGPSFCGDLYVDTGEECDDGNAVSGDGCESDCTVSAATAFRVVQIELVEPHFYDGVGMSCLDLTSNVNRDLQDAVDGYTINYVLVFRPLDPTSGTTPVDFVSGATCASGTPRDGCSLGSGVLTPMTATNHTSPSHACFTADPSTLNPSYSAPNSPHGPCFVTSEHAFTLDNGDYTLPISAGRIAATYGTGSPPTTLVTGIMALFLTEADAQATVYPLSSLVYAGDTVYEHLAAARAPGSSCSMEDDRDVYGGTTGFWYYVDITAERIDWTD